MEEDEQLKGLRFFRVLLPGFSTKLRLPCDFKKCLLKSRAATLCNPTGQIWRASCYKEKDGNLFIGGVGWREFIVANRIRIGFFLVFNYKGDMVFGCRAFGLSTKEISYLPSKKNKTSSEMKKEIIVLDDTEEETSSGAGAMEMPAPYKKRKSREDTSCLQEEKILPERKKEMIVLDDIEEEQNYIAMDEPAPLKKRKTKEKPSYRRRSQRLAHVYRDQSGNQEQVKRNAKLAQFPVTIEACNLDDRGRHCLKIPFKLASLLKGHKKVNVMDPTGRVWRIGLYHCLADDAIYTGKGWLDFARANGVKDGSKFIVELRPQVNASTPVMTVKILNSDTASTDHQCSIKKARKGHHRFETTINSKNLKCNFMHLPSKFLKSNGALTRCAALKIRDLQCRMWTVSISHHYIPRWRANISKGWREFALGNNLEVGTKCIFELVPGQKNTLQVLQVIREDLPSQLKLEC